MTTIPARAGDRMDIYAAQRSGALTRATLGAWLRANPELPYALPAGTTVNVPDPADTEFAYGASYVPLAGEMANFPFPPLPTFENEFLLEVNGGILLLPLQGLLTVPVASGATA